MSGGPLTQAPRPKIEYRWPRRGRLAAALRAALYVVPVALALSCSGLTLVVASRPGATLGAVGWMGVSILAGAIAVLVVAAGRGPVLSLASMLELALVFNHQPPSRIRLLVRLRKLRRRRGQLMEFRRGMVVSDVAANEPGTFQPGDLAVHQTEDILTLLGVLDAVQPGTLDQAKRVALISDRIAQGLGVSSDERDRLAWAALAHDLGHLILPDELLNSRLPLTASEASLMHLHPDAGAKMVEPLASWLGQWALAVEDHHEHVNGAGYPRGLSGDGISLGGRIVAVAAAFASMTSDLPHRRASDAETAMRELVRSSGSQFDPRVISALYGWHEPHASHRIGGRPAHTLTSLVTGSRWTVQAIAVGTMSALGIGLVGLALVSGRPLVPGPPGATTADAARPTDGATGAGGADSGGASSTASKPVSSGAIGAGGQPGATSAGGAGTNPSTVPSPSGPAGTGPVVSIPGSASAVEGVSVTLQGSFSDPAGRAWTGYVTYGDSSPPEPVIVSGNRFSVTHTYAEEGGYELQVWITNESATFGSAATRVAVSDYRPVVNLASATMVGGGPIGTVMNASGSFIDPSRDTWTATVDYGDGTGPTSLALVDHNFSLNHMYAHPGVYTVTVVIRDDEGISGEGRLSVTASP